MPKIEIVDIQQDYLAITDADIDAPDDQASKDSWARYFAIIHQELQRKQFTEIYQELRNACHQLSPFSDHLLLLSFFHDLGTDYPTKDIILEKLIAAYTRDKRYNALSGLFILVFARLIINRC